MFYIRNQKKGARHENEVIIDVSEGKFFLMSRSLEKGLEFSTRKEAEQFLSERRFDFSREVYEIVGREEALSEEGIVETDEDLIEWYRENDPSCLPASERK